MMGLACYPKTGSVNMVEYPELKEMREIEEASFRGVARQDLPGKRESRPFA
jgi:hypothetical protein